MKALIALGLRGVEAWGELAGRTLADIPGRLADRLDPPPRLPLQVDTFPNVLLCDLTPSQKGRVMAEDPDGYWEQVDVERAAETQEKRR